MTEKINKVFVLDTNVLLHDPEAIFNFEDNDVIIPMVVIEEIDNHKHDVGQVGRNARQISRALDELRKEGCLDEGVQLPGGGYLRVELADEELMNQLPNDFNNNADNRILAVALYCDPFDDICKTCELNLAVSDLECADCDKIEESVPRVTIVTKDTNLRIKANAIGLPAADYISDKIDFDKLYSGTNEAYVSVDLINEIYKEDGCIDLSDDIVKYSPNEYITLINNADHKQTALARYDAPLDRLFRITEITKDNAPMGLIPRNREQRFAMDLLLDPNILLVSLIGKAGTGKTLMAIAAGLYGVTETGEFDRVLITRPVISLGKQDIGFLPGTLEEKMAPWMRPIEDNIEVLLGKADQKDTRGSLDKDAVMMSPSDYLKKAGKLEVQALNYIRGRSIPKQYIIVDEAQNLTPHEIKTIVTRAGEGTKIVLTGDPYQIDNIYVDACSNGLTYIAEKFKLETISGHITLTKGERSRLAELAAELL